MPALRCFTASGTELYERGLPHLILISADQPVGKRAPSVAKQICDHLDRYTVHWPRAVARGFVRGAALDLRLESPESLAEATRSDDLERDEAQRLLRTMLATPTRANDLWHEQWLLCLEGLIGSDTLLEILTEELYALDEERKGLPGDNSVPLDDALPGLFGYLAGYLLLRASPSVATATRARLESLWQRTVEGEGSLDEHSLRAGLDLALHGMTGARRVLPQSHWQYLNMWGFVDDADMLRERLENNSKADWYPDPRHAWLGGEAILAMVCTKRRVHGCGKRRLAFFEQIGLIDHPVVEATMVEWRDDKRAGEYATRWLAEHGSTKPRAKAAVKSKRKPDPKNPKGRGRSAR